MGVWVWLLPNIAMWLVPVTASVVETPVIVYSLLAF
jgi:hypothetical protein